ncbi:MAG: hypothetical protein AAFU71_02960 [Cyanobacteria bacterium J06632_22]
MMKSPVCKNVRNRIANVNATTEVPETVHWHKVNRLMNQTVAIAIAMTAPKALDKAMGISRTFSHRTFFHRAFSHLKACHCGDCLHKLTNCIRNT